MEDRYIEYIDEKVDKIVTNIKWAAGIFVTVMVIFMGWVAQSTIKNRIQINDIEYNIRIVEADIEATRYKILWIAEVSSLVKEYYMKGNSEDAEFLERVQRMEDRIMEGGQPSPTFRGSKR